MRRAATRRPTLARVVGVAALPTACLLAAQCTPRGGSGAPTAAADARPALDGTRPGREAADRAALAQTGDSIRAAFARGDAAAAMAYHHPDVVKAFNVADSVVDGRDAVRVGLEGTLKRFRLQFVENRVERVRVHGDAAVEITRFAIRGTPRHSGDGAPFVFRGRTMVVYVRSPASPTGWASISELIQPAPE